MCSHVRQLREQIYCCEVITNNNSLKKYVSPPPPPLLILLSGINPSRHLQRSTSHENENK